MARRVLALAAMLLVWLTARDAGAWIENHVLGDDVRVTVDRSGKAEIEHRLTLKTNGSQHLEHYLIEGIDGDAEPLPGAYAVPERDALSSSLANAVPLVLEVVPPEEKGGTATLRIDVDDKKGLWRGSYVLVLRYATDLRARDRLVRDGALVRLSWRGPRFADGFDSARVTFVVPRAPTEPRAAESPEGEEGTASSIISEVRRGGDHDEVELFRTYARKGEPIAWSIKLDPRALEALPVAAEPEDAPPGLITAAAPLPRGELTMALAGLFFLFVVALIVAKDREVRRCAEAAGAEARPVVPISVAARAPLAAASLVGGLFTQLWLNRPLVGAALVVVASLFAMHGGARAAPTIRGPGRWLTVTEEEGLGLPPRPRGAWLDTSTRVGKVLLVVSVSGLFAGAYFLARRSWLHGLELSFDGVFLLAVFGTGRIAALPPDMSVEPGRFLRRLARALRRRKELTDARIVPRIRVPTGAMDPDELRLLVAPRVPLRGFHAIEIGVSFGLGFGGRTTLPEVLVRVAEGSACEEALRRVREKGRVTPGRRPDERVIAFSPRLPTVRMTADIIAALALRVTEASAPRSEEGAHVEGKPRPERKTRPRPPASARERQRHDKSA